MKRRWIGVVAVALVALALAAQLLRARRLEDASHVLRTVEQVSVAVAARGQVPPGLLWDNVKLLQRAHERDPADSRILLAIGGQYLLLGRPEDAIATYERALEIEPRPEIFLNLARAQERSGELEAARESYRRAQVLDPRQRPLVPREHKLPL